MHLGNAVRGVLRARPFHIVVIAVSAFTLTAVLVVIANRSAPRQPIHHAQLLPVIVPPPLAQPGAAYRQFRQEFPGPASTPGAASRPAPRR